MKKYYLVLAIGMIALLTAISCDEKNEVTPETIVDVEFEYTPDPAIVDSVVQLSFKSIFVEETHDDGHDDHNTEDTDDHTHPEISSVTCEVHMQAGEEEISLSSDGGGHYEGTHVFSEAGTYELHFSYMHESEMNEKEFEISVVE